MEYDISVDWRQCFQSITNFMTQFENITKDILRYHNEYLKILDRRDKLEDLISNTSDILGSYEIYNSQFSDKIINLSSSESAIVDEILKGYEDIFSGINRHIVELLKNNPHITENFFVDIQFGDINDDDMETIFNMYLFDISFSILNMNNNTVISYDDELVKIKYYPKKTYSYRNFRAGQRSKKQDIKLDDISNPILRALVKFITKHERFVGVLLVNRYTYQIITKFV